MRTSRPGESFHFIVWAMVALGCAGNGGFAASSTELRETPSAASSASTEGVRWDLAEAFDFLWESVEVSTRLVNLAVGTGGQPNPGGLAARVTIGVRWAGVRNFVMFDVASAQVYELLDEDGRTIPYRNRQSDQNREYDNRDWRWTGEGQAYLNPGGRQVSFDAKIQFPVEPNHAMPSGISSLRGYIGAVYADEIVGVKIPFDPNLGAVENEKVPGLVFSVHPTTPPPPKPPEYVCVVPSENRALAMYRPRTALGLYQYSTSVESKTEEPILTLTHAVRYPGKIYAFREYAVVRTELYDLRRKVVRIPSNQTVNSAFRRVHCFGSLPQTGEDETFDRICHVVLVRPMEVKIPFVLTDIPLARLSK
ncbi:MAG TPA: hypothetical protein VLI39_01780 [Sedimentisphaerales bacterium]|nr:hypothetical protein [Sedimentisphaerales bacterium]